MKCRCSVTVYSVIDKLFVNVVTQTPNDVKGLFARSATQRELCGLSYVPIDDSLYRDITRT